LKKEFIVKYLHIRMKSTSLELFWVEKIKLTQNTINLTKSLSDRQLDYPSDLARSSIRKTLHKMAQHDRKFSFYLPLSIRMSLILPLSPIRQEDLEQELTKIRDLFDPPALPPFLSEIISRESRDLDISETNASLEGIWAEWIHSLSHIESMIYNLTEEESLRIRYFTLTGIYALPSMINLTAMQNHHDLKEGILKLLKDSEFPSAD
jgi:hypothetical protein